MMEDEDDEEEGMEEEQSDREVISQFKNNYFAEI